MKEIATLSDKDVGLPDEYTDVKPRIAARAVLYDQQGRVALLSLDHGAFFMLPGGQVDAGETPQEAARRELLEETGCESELVGFLGLVRENRAKLGITQLSYYYLAKVVGPVGQPCLEQSELQDNLTTHWLPLEAAQARIYDCRPEDLARRFTRLRDLAALKEAKEQLD